MYFKTKKQIPYYRKKFRIKQKIAVLCGISISLPREITVLYKISINEAERIFLLCRMSVSVTIGTELEH
jgi:hypothetical protein